MKRASLFVGLVLLAPAGLLGAACGGAIRSTAGDDAGAMTDAGQGGATSDRTRLDAAVHPDAACAVTIDTPPIEPGVHVAIGTPITWSSNPPSSGAHFPIWAAYQTFATAVPRGYYVHDLEHGAVVLLYRCDAAADAGCADVVAALQKVVDALPDDPLCTSIADRNDGVRVRAVITPDPDIPTPIAAAAWGWTYTADCVDLPSLTAFASEHYGQGTEQLCGNGQAQF